MVFTLWLIKDKEPFLPPVPQFMMVKRVIIMVKKRRRKISLLSSIWFYDGSSEEAQRIAIPTSWVNQPPFA